jgi:molybdopterin converting factor small subunit
MIIDFKYLGLPKKELNTEVNSIEVEEDADVKVLLDEIMKKYKISKEIFKGCNYMVNNRRSNLDTKLKDGDYILITKSLGGG